MLPLAKRATVDEVQRAAKMLMAFYMATLPLRPGARVEQRYWTAFGGAVRKKALAFLQRSSSPLVKRAAVDEIERIADGHAEQRQHR